MSSDGLCDALQDKIHESALLTLREQMINGVMFVQLTEDDLKDLFPQVGACLSVPMNDALPWLRRVVSMLGPGTKTR